jgi:two-component sensor histidine kinase
MSAYDYAQHLAGRLDAMARTQSIITRSPSEGIEIEDLVREELLAQAPAEDRFHLEGPAVLLSPKAAEVLTLAVHELATNSIKYGSLGAEGELSVTWGVEERDAEDWLALVWEEAGVENSGPAARHGFGTELITKRVPYELEGTGMIEIESRGMRATIAFPLRDIGSILETGSATRQEQRA